MLKKHEVILSDYILREFEEKLCKKLKFPPAQVSLAKTFLAQRCLVITLRSIPKIKFGDQKDILILELLAFAKPHYFITSDKMLLKLRKQGGTVFLTPREAMEML